MTTNALVPAHSNLLQQAHSNLNNALNVLIYSLSASSRRVYKHTFDLWVVFAQSEGISPLDFSPQFVIAFLESEELSKSTRQARLTHIRRLVNLLYAANPSDAVMQSYYLQLKELRVKGEKAAGRKRDKQALPPQGVYRAFGTWQGENLLAKRNRAILAVLFYAGLRRSEVVALRWTDVDLDEGLIYVWHGKGDKERTTPILSDIGITVIQEWKMAMPEDRIYMFPSIRKGDHLEADEPMSDSGLYRIIKQSGDFSPHDARRTLITGALSAGSSVADVQYIAGHVNPQTTLGYAQVKDAKEVKGRVKLNY